MTPVFADTFFWVALAHPHDTAHQDAIDLKEALGDRLIVTTDEVLVEFLNYFSEKGELFRHAVAQSVSDLLDTPTIRVIEQSRSSFRAGLDFYKTRLDKGYSLTDCISMNTMKAEGLTEVLTNDEHFTQEGFSALFRS